MSLAVPHVATECTTAARKRRIPASSGSSRKTLREDRRRSPTCAALAHADHIPDTGPLALCARHGTPFSGPVAGGWVPHAHVRRQRVAQAHMRLRPRLPTSELRRSS